MVHAAAAEMTFADLDRRLDAQKTSLAEADDVLELAILRARQIYDDDADTAVDPTVLSAAERLVDEADALEALQRERDVALVAHLLWMREATLMIRAISKK